MDELKHTREVYNRIARKYHDKRRDPEQGSWNIFLEEPAIASVLEPLVSGRRVLDLGCGTGILTRQMIAWGGEVSGVDISDEMIRLARAEMPEIDFQIASATDLLYNSETFEVVASSLVMHYLQDLRPSFREVARVLKPAGDFVFSMHHPMQEAFNVAGEMHNGKPVLQPYFHNDVYTWQMCGGELVSFHHTFEDIVRSLKDTGFVLIDLVECRPAESAQESFKDFERTSKYPTFCVFHARRSDH